MEKEKENLDEWRLDKIELKFESYGEDKGKYKGKITFGNGHWESFTFMIKPSMAERYIEVISEDVVKSASQLSEKLLKSLKLDKKD